MLGLRNKMFSKHVRVLLGIAVIVAPVALCLAVYTYFNFPFANGVVTSKRSQTGIETCVIQVFKGYEPYQVSLLMKTPGASWREFYLAHQDSRWRSARIDIDETQGRVLVYRGDALVKEYPLLADQTHAKGWHDGNYYLAGDLSENEAVRVLAAHYRKW